MSTAVQIPEFHVTFTAARRQKIKAKIGLFGPSGSGKTLAAMRMAIAIQDMLDSTKPVAAIDSEHERISLYAEEEEFLDANGETRFRVYPMKAPYSPAHYIAAFDKAESLGAQVCMVDSISHEWFGKGGIQQIVDEAAARQTGDNKWAGWSVGTPAHNSFIEAVLGSQMHMVCTMRAKTDWIQVGGKPKKVGLGPVQREGVEYEFDVVLKLDLDHTAEVETSRSIKFFNPGSAVTAEELGRPFAEKVWAWISEGADRDEAKTAEEVQAEQDLEQGVAQERAVAEAEQAAADGTAPVEEQERFDEQPAEASGNTELPPDEEPTETPAEAPAAATETPAEEPAAEAEQNGAITPATKGLITKGIANLQTKHGDWDGGTDWDVRLRTGLVNQKWNTRKVENVNDLTEDEGQKLLATIANTDETVAARKLELAAAEEAARAAENEQQSL